MRPKLSICIPTFNRSEYLRTCLKAILPQAEARRDVVEVIVIDNASPDETQEMLEKLKQKFSCLKYYRNERNLGYSGNQAKCVEYATGNYMALLCDDDIYLDGQVDSILNTIWECEYAFIALNYYGFIKNILKPYQGGPVPEQDVIFERAYDILNYPTVGHLSGMIFNADLAKNALATIVNKKKYKTYEKYRGLIAEVAARVTGSSTLPAYFIGKRGLACRMPNDVDYDTLHHLCLDFCEFWQELFKEGLISKCDFDHRVKEALMHLPRGIVGGVPYIDNDELKQIIEKFTDWFGEYKEYRYIYLPMLRLGKFGIVKSIYKVMRFIYKLCKKFIWFIKA